MPIVAHLLSGLRYGGKEQVAIDLARTGIAQGHRHLLLLYDTPYRSPDLDLDPRGVPWIYLARQDRGFDWTLPVRIGRVLRREGVSVLHAHAETAIVYAALAKSLLLKPRVATLGTFHVRSSPLGLRGRLAVHLAARIADRLVAVSQSLAADIRAQGLRSEIATVPNGTDLTLFKPSPVLMRRAARRRLAIPEHAFVLGTLGRLDSVKRQVDLLAAAEGLRDDHRFHLVVGGDGPLRGDLLARATATGNATILGAISDRADFYAALDAFALCSEHEAAPLVLLEAMACGLPIIATSVGGIPEMVAPHDHLLRQLVPIGDIASLTEAIIRIMSPLLGSSDASIENRRVAEQFSLDEVYAKYAALYQSLARSAGGGTATGSANAW